MTQPFKVESADINQLSDIQLTQLLNELLHAEAHKFEIAQAAVEVSLNIRVGDDGEDGRISWVGGVERTDYIPNRLTMFQNKAAEMGPSAYANEIMTTERVGRPSVLKAKVAEVLHDGGAYVVFTTQELNKKQKDSRITAVRDRLREQGKGYADYCTIKIYDAAQISGWVNFYVSTIVSVLNWVGRPIERGLKTYTFWSEHEHLSLLPFAAVDSRSEIISTIEQGLNEEKSCYRIVGLSGLGKTRTAHHLIGESAYLKSLVVYVDANLSPQIDALVADWVNLSLKALVVVDNCDHILHERLVSEVKRLGSNLSLLTLDYNFESVSLSTVEFKLSVMKDEELLQLLKPDYQKRLPDLDRIVKFSQGFPQMAVLLAKARLAKDSNIGELSDDELVSKLLWGRDREENNEHLKILQACSLFDIFGVEKEVESQLQYISDFLGIDINDVFECIQNFTGRGLVDRRGRFGKIVPKPLAIRLASQWWSKTRDAKQQELVDGIPEGMLEGFCNQIQNLDFHPKVKVLTEKLYGPQGTSGQAEVILSIRGSRIFRSFVVVNPEATSNILYQVLESLNEEQIAGIDGDVRSNLVYALEMLCFHGALFEQSAWSLFLLAQYETESYRNNSTGIFSQLFGVTLSGTEAAHVQRFQLLQRIFELNTEQSDKILMDALESGIKTSGVMRMVGSEYQGIKAPLKEWEPESWQERYTYWQTCFDWLLRLLDRSEETSIRAKKIIGQSIRDFVLQRQIEMLDNVIESVIKKTGIYWPEALDNIKIAIEFDSNRSDEELCNALQKWLDLLSSKNASLLEKIKIIVLNPTCEPRKNEDGGYVDLAPENAINFAREFTSDLSVLNEHISLLAQGEQKQAFIFGQTLGKEAGSSNDFISLVIEYTRKNDFPISRFLLGILRGINIVDQKYWLKIVERFANEDELIKYFPEVIITGNINASHLEIILRLIKQARMEPSRLVYLSEGSVTNFLSPDEISSFCLSLSKINEQCKWPSLNIICWYCNGEKAAYNVINNALKELLVSVPLHSSEREPAIEMLQWRDFADRLLAGGDCDLAANLAHQMIDGCNKKLDQSDVRHYIKPLLVKLMEEYGDVLWPIFGDAIISAQGMQLYWLQQLLDKDSRFSSKKPSVLSVLPVETVIDWCKYIPAKGPSFVASCVNIFDDSLDGKKPSKLFVALLEEFGDDKRVQGELRSNMGSKGWSGSLVPYLEDDKAGLSLLSGHSSFNVRNWVNDYISNIERQIEHESIMDDEQDFGVYQL